MDLSAVFHFARDMENGKEAMFVVGGKKRAENTL